MLKLLVEGRRNREIGELLAISSKTVEKHRASLMKKVGVDTAFGLAALAPRHGLIESASMEATAPPDADTGDGRTATRAPCRPRLPNERAPSCSR